MLAATLSLTSCLGSTSDEQVLTYNYGSSESCFNRVIDLQDGSEFIASSPSYNLKYTRGSTGGNHPLKHHPQPRSLTALLQVPGNEIHSGPA